MVERPSPVKQLKTTWSIDFPISHSGLSSCCPPAAKVCQKTSSDSLVIQQWQFTRTLQDLQKVHSIFVAIYSYVKIDYSPAATRKKTLFIKTLFIIPGVLNDGKGN